MHLTSCGVECRHITPQKPVLGTQYHTSSCPRLVGFRQMYVNQIDKKYNTRVFPAQAVNGHSDIRSHIMRQSKESDCVYPLSFWEYYAHSESHLPGHDKRSLMEWRNASPSRYMFYTSAAYRLISEYAGSAASDPTRYITAADSRGESSYAPLEMLSVYQLILDCSPTDGCNGQCPSCFSINPSINCSRLPLLCPQSSIRTTCTVRKTKIVSSLDASHRWTR